MVVCGGWLPSCLIVTIFSVFLFAPSSCCLKDSKRRHHNNTTGDHCQNPKASSNTNILLALENCRHHEPRGTSQVFRGKIHHPTSYERHILESCSLRTTYLPTQDQTCRFCVVYFIPITIIICFLFLVKAESLEKDLLSETQPQKRRTRRRIDCEIIVICSQHSYIPTLIIRRRRNVPTGRSRFRRLATILIHVDQTRR